MASNDPQRGTTSTKHAVTVSDWNACYNSGDNIIALSCTVTTADASATISGVGLILNDSGGRTLASFYTGSAEGSSAVYPALNLPPENLTVGNEVSAVVQGECGGQHFFFEQDLTIKNC
jgi:hypothetical protein